LSEGVCLYPILKWRRITLLYQMLNLLGVFL